MAKQTHRVRVWAERGRRRRLEFSRDARRAREGALLVVDALKQDAGVDAVEMEEYVVLPSDGDGGTTETRRGTLRWVRSGTRWRRGRV
jgi:hypothetical protein